MFNTDYPQVYLNRDKPSTKGAASLPLIKGELLRCGIDVIPAGCLLVLTSAVSAHPIFFTIIEDIKVELLNTSRTRRLFVEAGSSVNYLGGYVEPRGGFPTDRVRLPYPSEVDLYAKLKTI